MKKIIWIMLFAFTFSYGKAQTRNYFTAADSCLKLKDYACAATNYELCLKADPESNGIAYMVAKAWAMANDKEKTFAALNLYIKNNALNYNPFFSEQLLKEKKFDFLKDDPRWVAMIVSVQKEEAGVTEQEIKANAAAKLNDRNFAAAMDVRPQLARLNINGELYTELKKLIIYKSPKAYLTDNGIALYIRIDGKDVPFYVSVPVTYNPAIANPVLVVLHGGILYSKGYGNADSFPMVYRATSEHIPNYSKKYITIYPIGTSVLNWMNTESGFDMVNKIVVYLKAFLNIDDNRVELLGHSNGATGVFTYLVKSPSLYAGFYGMNTQPKVFIGGTFLQNGVTRQFYNFATDKDYYYPPQAVKTIDSLANSLGVNWHTDLNKGYPHWFPSMKESLQPMAKIFEDMETRVRNPYPKEIYFETDNIKDGASDWITITGLDTLSKKASWQIDPNFKITAWIDNSDFNKTIHREAMAFDYPHRSGAIKAKKDGNNIYIETSDVASFAIKLNREMIDYRQKVNIYLNGRKVYSQKIMPDKQYTFANFKSQLDRKVIWENELQFDVK
jgi:pimeloyl-ACP methyl ester carboxylesterase